MRKRFNLSLLPVTSVAGIMFWLACLGPASSAASSEQPSDIASSDKSGSKVLSPMCSPRASLFGQLEPPVDDPNNPQSQTESDGSCRMPGTLSRYRPHNVIRNRSDKSVESELEKGNQIKPSLIPMDFVHYRLKGVYQAKDRINDKLGLAFGVDYTALAQHANYTESGHNTAASQVLRVLGTWRPSDQEDSGYLVWKTETRGAMGGLPTPRDMGFDTGSALSTANFKELDYWGVTDLYWRQHFKGVKADLLVGHMDPGDWADQYPLLNAWTSFMSDAFYNNPTEAIPKRGAGIVGEKMLKDGAYLAGGIHDAHGKDGKLDPSSPFRNGDFFSWIEYGYRSSNSWTARQNYHVHLWHQDRLEDSDTDASWGVALTHSIVSPKQNVWFIRAGYSEGNAPQMRSFVGGGFSAKILGRDTLGVATSWGKPPDKSLRSQVTSEVFYRLQVTQNLTITPSLQLTHNPSYTVEEDWIYIPGVRVRIVF